MTIVNLNQVIIAARGVLNNANADIGPLVKDLRETADLADKAMESISATLVKIQQVLDPDSPFVVHLNQTLESLDQTSRLVGELTDYLQRNPAALVRGRYVSDHGK